MKKAFIIPAVLLGIGIGGLGINQVLAQRNVQPAESNPTPYVSSSWGMMQSFTGSNISSVQSLSKQQTNAAMKSSLQHATVDKKANTITYSRQNVTIVFFAGPKEADGKFVVGGLVNPTIHLLKGTHVQFKVINMDNGMPHGIEMTTAKPPYSYMSMMQGGIYSGSFIPPLPEAQKGQYPVASSTFVANQTGNFHYLCQVPGHAAKGMYGKVVVS